MRIKFRKKNLNEGAMPHKITKEDFVAAVTIAINEVFQELRPSPDVAQAAFVEIEAALDTIFQQGTEDSKRLAQLMGVGTETSSPDDLNEGLFDSPAEKVNKKLAACAADRWVAGWSAHEISLPESDDHSGCGVEIFHHSPKSKAFIQLLYEAIADKDPGRAIDYAFAWAAMDASQAPSAARKIGGGALTKLLVKFASEIGMIPVDKMMEIAPKSAVNSFKASIAKRQAKLNAIDKAAGYKTNVRGTGGIK